MTDLAGLNIKYLPGVGPKRAELLNKELEIFTYLDLLHYYPYKYIDRSKTYKINEIDGSMPYIQLRGKIVSYTTHGEGARRRLTALFSDGSGVIELVWFKGIRYITDRYKPGTEYTLFGKPTLFNGKFNIAHPELDPIDGLVPVPISAQVEADLAELDADERAEYLSEMGLDESGLGRLVREAYRLLGLQSFFTSGETESRAWTVPIGAKAPQAAGVIHSDFERGFIKAETASYEDYVSNGGEKGCRESGKLRQEGKDYVVQDGDVMHFKFNV